MFSVRCLRMAGIAVGLARPATDCQYGDTLALLLQLEIEYQDASRQTVISDADWKCSTGALVYSDLFIGERYDATLENPNWLKPDFDDAHWKDVTTANYGYANLVARVPANRCVLSPKSRRKRFSQRRAAKASLIWDKTYRANFGCASKVQPEPKLYWTIAKSWTSKAIFCSEFRRATKTSVMYMS